VVKKTPALSAEILDELFEGRVAPWFSVANAVARA
jgi:hypothetical protein